MLERGKMDRGVLEIVDTESLVPSEHLLRKIDAAVDFNVSVNSSNAVDKREQPPRKDGCSLFHVNARLRRKKMERRLQEKQIPIGLLSKQVVLQVGEAAQFSGGGIRYKVKESVSEDALVLKDVQVCKRDSRKLVRHSGTSPGCVGLQNLKIGHWVSFPSFRHWVGD